MPERATGPISTSCSNKQFCSQSFLQRRVTYMILFWQIYSVIRMLKTEKISWFQSTTLLWNWWHLTRSGAQPPRTPKMFNRNLANKTVSKKSMVTNDNWYLYSTVFRIIAMLYIWCIKNVWVAKIWQQIIGFFLHLWNSWK